MKKNYQVDMGRGPILQVVLSLALPAMISMLFQNLYALIDTMFISNLGTLPLAAQSLAVPLFYFALSVGKGVQVGTASLISQARGQGKDQEVKTKAAAALPLLLILMLLLFPLLIPGVGSFFFKILGASGDVCRHAYNYTFWMILGFPVMSYVMIAEAISMSHGNTVTPMKSMIIGNCLNVVLNPFFMFTLGMGIAGSSLATLIGQLVSALYMRSKLKKDGLVTPAIRFDSTTLSQWKQIGSLGFFVAITLLISPLGLSLLNGVLASLGPAAVGAWNIMSRLEMLGLLPLYGMASALIPFMAYNYGQKNYSRIQEGVRFCLIFSVIFILPVIAVFIFLPHYLMFPFQAGNEVRQLGIQAIRLAAFGHIFIPVEIALYSSAQGLRRPWYLLVAIVFRILFVRYPLAILFAVSWGINGVYWCQPASTGISVVLSAALLAHLLKQVRKDMNTAQTGFLPL